MPDEEDIEAKIAAEERRIAELHREAAEAKRRIAELRGRRDGYESPSLGACIEDGSGAAPPGTEEVPSSTWSPQEKVELFAGLFAGRTDVFPLRWESRDRRKSGWAPRCDNEWKPGICQKPRIRCGECSHQA